MSLYRGITIRILQLALIAILGGAAWLIYQRLPSTPSEDQGENGTTALQILMVTGYGETVGAAMTNHPALRLISFTGSTETGRIVASACAERNAICSLEMGGKNAIIVMDDADVDLAIEGAIWEIGRAA